MTKPKYGLTLPMAISRPLLAGVLGKEKALALTLSARQLALLLGLAAHVRGFAFEGIAPSLSLHPYGWIAINDNHGLQAELLALAGVLKGSDFIIESHQEQLFRLSVPPEDLYFDEQLFTFTVTQADLDSVNTKISVSIERKAFSTSLGSVQASAAAFVLTLELVHKLKALATHPHVTDDEKAVKRNMLIKKACIKTRVLWTWVYAI
jgi:hypothetical protein